MVDDECKVQNGVVNSSAREYRCDPACVRKQCWRERKILIRMKKIKASETLHIQLSNMRTRHPWEFWKVMSRAAAVHHAQMYSN